jgi:hypothetical protein
MAPIKRNKQIRSNNFTLKNKRCVNTSLKESTKLKIIKKSAVLNVHIIKIIPKIKKTSAILFMIIAFSAALFANILVCQKFISKYEHKPTPSQPTNNCTKLSEVTNSTIQNVNKPKKQRNLTIKGSCDI